jgi:hypothetical protein
MNVGELMEDLFLEIEKKSIFTDGDIIEIDSENLYEIVREFILDNFDVSAE